MSSIFEKNILKWAKNYKKRNIMERLKELRTSKNLTQTELAKVFGCNQTAIGKYERGELYPNFSLLIKLADFFEVSVDYLIGREDDFGNIMVSQSTDQAELSSSEKECLQLFSSLGIFEKDSILIQMRALVQSTKDKKGIKI